MPNSRRFLYWDACVFLSYLNGDGDRLGAIQAVLDEVRDREDSTIVTSVVSKIEVAYCAAEQARKELDTAVEAQIDAMWADRSVVTLVELNDDIARLARTLVRDGLGSGRSVKPLDALHLATAQWVEASEMHTFDDGLLAKFGRGFACPVREPHAQQARLPLPRASGRATEAP